MPHIEEQLETITTLRDRAAQRATHHQRRIERLARYVGRPRSVYLLLAVIVVWTTLNVVLRRPFDRPPFFALQGALAVYAAFVTTIVLIVQNRQQHESEHQYALQLQVNLAAEQKAAKVIGLLEELRRDLPIVRDRHDPEAERLERAVDTKAVAQALEERVLIRDSAPQPPR